jgi:hypothetical protein
MPSNPIAVGSFEHGGAIANDMSGILDQPRRVMVPNQIGQALTTIDQGDRAEIATVYRQQIEGVEQQSVWMVGNCGAERAEIGATLLVLHHDLAVQDDRGAMKLASSLDDGPILLAPIIAVARECQALPSPITIWVR